MNLCFLSSLMLIIFAWLLPYHKSPWPTFGSEILTFLAASFLLLGLYQEKIKIARPQLIALPMVLIPLMQWSFGIELYFSNALLCSAYILMFWLMVVAGTALSDTPKSREMLFTRVSFVLIVVSLISSVIAICQWLSLSAYFSPLMYSYKGNRPYANLAQPNNLATLLTMGLLGCLYFYETHKVKLLYLIPISLILLFSIALTQSRTSWVTCLFILIYLSIKQFNKSKRFTFTRLLLWVGLFIAFVATLPLINQFVMMIASHEMLQTASAVERATSGYLRLDMWTQMLVAISEHPWLGYGWNQTGMAQIAAFDLYPSHEWYKSAHNIVLDLLIWNGIPLGILIILYFVAWLYWLNKGVKEPISIIATLMVCAVLIHGLLEYPLHYAYFLLPAGFLLGIIQAQYKSLPNTQISSKWVDAMALLCIIGCGVVVHDYMLYKQQSKLADRKTPLTIAQRDVMNQDIYVLTQFEERIWWIGLNPKTQMDQVQLQYIGRMVANLASKYDIYKYAQILAFNGHSKEAKHQLWILSELHGEQKNYDDLLK